ncbi:hypothetical protein GB931_07170 [Modestobacter sp. I12A-02628]|uniref:Uncharacterized protein n=1 Tax=Goekera deserti TaxID=2497753 RepID=A0A7K3WCE2_9ACTN|nr:hypothetical protein [Goekera deserti]MPQ97704.1 hypothetical protein [Goekera deserti]NDI47629.1 hypothetical protein [Goekera deserti]NDI47692.1 hypothetical protein [Goekera deserti]NEL53440.1 hypothetical protein [Goekera deserti]
MSAGSPREAADDAAVVLGWMSRLAPSRALAEDLTVEVFGRLTGRQPGWLARCPAGVQQRFHSAQAVLEFRGVL